MITFKQFLSEKAVSKQPVYKPVHVKKAIQLLNTHAKDALWMLHKNQPLYRGDNNAKLGDTGFALVDTAATKRQSQNTSNYYTVIFDNHPEYKDFPKRSRSFICSTKYDDAKGFGYNSTNIVIPFDGVRIGAVNEDDMWMTDVRFLGRLFSVSDLNDYWRDLGLSPSMASFKAFGKSLKNPNSESSRCFKDTFGSEKYDAVKDNFFDTVMSMYSPKMTGHTVHTTANFYGIEGEVWVGGKVMMIAEDMWEELRAALK